MQRMHLQLHRESDFSGVQRAAAVSLAAAGIVAALLSVEAPVRTGVAALLAPSASERTANPTTTAAAQTLDVLLRPATTASRVDAGGQWVAYARVHTIHHSRAALEFNPREYAVVSLLGVRVYGLPAGAIDLSMLAGATVIMRGGCDIERATGAACSVASVQIVDLDAGPVRVGPSAERAGTVLHAQAA